VHLVPEPDYAPALDLRPPPIPAPKLRPGVAGCRRGRVAEDGHEEGGLRRLALGAPLHCRRREREAAGASARATRVRWGCRGMAPQRSVADVVRRCRSGKRSEE